MKAYLLTMVRQFHWVTPFRCPGTLRFGATRVAKPAQGVSRLGPNPLAPHIHGCIAVKTLLRCVN
jgi:hypothetical protein